MFRFEKEQSVWDFNGTKIGGQPGEYPTVLGASIFYNKHECVLDDHKGTIDKAKAEALWNRCQVLSDITGIPHFIQIIAEYGEAFESYFSWFDSIDNKTAFLMDSSAPKALAHACKYVTEVGLAHRAIYNSINGSIPQENIDAIKNSDVDAAIVLAFNPGDPSVAGREKVLFEEPAEKVRIWSASFSAGGDAVLVFAIKDQQVAEYHYLFYRAVATITADHFRPERLARFHELLREELRGRVHGELDEEGWKLKQSLFERQSDVRRDTKLFRSYARQSLIDSLTLYLHGICCDIDVETGPRQLPSRHLRRRLELFHDMFPPPDGYAVFPEEVKT